MILVCLEAIKEESMVSAGIVNQETISELDSGLEKKHPVLDTYDELVIKKSEKIIPTSKQNILRGSGTLELLIKLLSLFPAPNSRDKGGDPIYQFQAKLLDFLAFAIASNQDNQNLAIKQLPLLNEIIFSNTTTTESLLFAKAFIHDNKQLLLSESMCRNMIRILCIYENQRSQTVDLKRILIFNLLSEFCQYKGYPIKRNQQMIISNLTDQGENKIARKLNSVKYKTIFANFSNKLSEYKFQNEQNRVISLPLDIKLVLSVINLLNMCNEGENPYVANISIKTITLESVTKWMKAPLPVPIKIIILRYIYNAYLGEEVDLPDVDLIELLSLFRSLATQLEMIEELNKIGEDEIKDYYIITHDNYLKSTQFDQEYLSLFLDTCKKLFIISILRSEDQLIVEEATSFSNILNTSLQSINLGSPDGMIRAKIYELQSLLEGVISKHADSMKDRQIDLKAYETQYSRAQVKDFLHQEKSISEFKGESTYEVFHHVVKQYTESDFFKKDVDDELDSLIRLVLETQGDAEQLQGTIPLNISTLCTSLISYLTISEVGNSENQRRCINE